MNDKPFQVINPRGVAWGVRFTSEQAALRRLVALKGLPDRAESYTVLYKQGWKITNCEGTASSGGLAPRNE